MQHHMLPLDLVFVWPSLHVLRGSSSLEQGFTSSTKTTTLESAAKCGCYTISTQCELRSARNNTRIIHKTCVAPGMRAVLVSLKARVYGVGRPSPLTDRRETRRALSFGILPCTQATASWSEARGVCEQHRALAQSSRQHQPVELACRKSPQVNTIQAACDRLYTTRVITESFDVFPYLTHCTSLAPAP